MSLLLGYLFINILSGSTAVGPNKLPYCISMTKESKCRNNLGNCPNVTCTTGAPYCHTVFRNTSQGFVAQLSGCWSVCPDNVHNVTQCLVFHMTMKNHYSCCCSGNRCNANTTFIDVNLMPITTQTTIAITTTDSSDYSSSKLAVFILTPTLFFGIMVVVLTYLWSNHKKTQARIQLRENDVLCTPPIQSRPLQMHEQVSRGQFGCVWKALYDHKTVAVKIIQKHERASWDTERSIYSDYNLQHENILKFYSAEKRCEAGCIQYWIITEFHDHGSLADYLHATILDFEGFMNIIMSVVSGLVYLHEDNMGKVPPKPSIAHRDFKSRNILVKSDGKCCIGDFGTSCSFPDGYETDEAKAQVGTKRYMAPEVLQGAVAFQAESFLCIDVYALSLVMWECLSRCNLTTAAVENYCAPYEAEVGFHPTIEDMRACVLDRHYRPIIKPEWQEDNKLAPICDTVIECWDDEADARLTASCVYERLVHLNRKPSVQQWDINELDNDRTRLIDGNSDGCCVVELSNDLSISKPPEYSSGPLEYSTVSTISTSC